MAAITILALTCAGAVLAQSPHSSPGFEYKGCSTIDLSCFSDPVDLPGGRVTPEACQAACQGYQLAALLNEECRCGNDTTAVESTDESMCDHACMDDATLGCCGNSCPSDNPGTANVYGQTPVLDQYSQAPPPPATTSCPPEVEITPVGLPPEPATQAGTQLESTSCPPPEASQYQTPDAEAPEPKSYETSIAEPAEASSTAPELSPYETTLWPKPASASDPYGTPPAPSQVSSSDSTACSVPPLGILGGLAFIAAMII